MPTKKKRINIIPDNLPPLQTPEETCPALYTGQSLFEKDPKKYALAVQLLGEGKPMTRIAKSLKISPETVSAIAKREKGSIDSVRELTAGLTSYAAQACVMKIIQALDEDKVPVGVLPIAFGILADKERQYQGEATTIIEHRKVVTIDEVQKELESIKNEAIDVEPGE
jgi:predicted transcriptional regulator